MNYLDSPAYSFKLPLLKTEFIIYLLGYLCRFFSVAYCLYRWKTRKHSVSIEICTGNLLWRQDIFHN